MFGSRIIEASLLHPLPALGGLYAGLGLGEGPSREPVSACL